MLGYLNMQIVAVFVHIFSTIIVNFIEISRRRVWLRITDSRAIRLMSTLLNVFRLHGTNSINRVMVTESRAQEQ